MKTELKHRFSLHVCVYPPQLFVFFIVYPPADAGVPVSLLLLFRLWLFTTCFISVSEKKKGRQRH